MRLEVLRLRVRKSLLVCHRLYITDVYLVSINGTTDRARCRHMTATQQGERFPQKN